MTARLLRVSVVWATPDVQDIVPLTLPAGSSVDAAIAKSEVALRYALDMKTLRVGVNGHLAQPDTMLADGDRVEIYRPLLADPKEARRSRALENPFPKSPPVAKRRRRP